MSNKLKFLDVLPSWGYHLPEGVSDGEAAWSGKSAPPAIGDTVTVGINNIGKAVVVRYFTEGGFLGVYCRPLDPPAWYAKQNGRDIPCHIFGVELK